MELHPQRSSFGIETFVKIGQLRIGIEAEDRRRMYAFEDQGARKLSRTAAGVHDTAVIVEIPYGQRRHLARRAVGCQVLRNMDALAALPFAHRIVGPVVAAVEERQFIVLLPVVEHLRQRIRPVKATPRVVIQK